MANGTFSRVKFYADYESVIRNAKFALLMAKYHHPKIIQIRSGKNKPHTVVQFTLILLFSKACSAYMGFDFFPQNNNFLYASKT